MRDFLEQNVNEKYYLSKKMKDLFFSNEAKQKSKGNGFTFNVSDGNNIAHAITTRAGGRMDDNYIADDVERVENIKRDVVRAGHFNYADNKKHQSNVFYDTDGIPPTINTAHGSGRVGIMEIINE